MQKEETDTIVEESEMEQKVVASEDYRKEKYIALFQARTILSKHGTMQERRICSKLLKIMKRDGVKSL